jgi:uncharacterized coiled-coil protein SlyX
MTVLGGLTSALIGLLSVVGKSLHRRIIKLEESAMQRQDVEYLIERKLSNMDKRLSKIEYQLEELSPMITNLDKSVRKACDKMVELEYRKADK